VCVRERERERERERDRQRERECVDIYIVSYVSYVKLMPSVG
jgi:hypothetical protein